MELRRLGELDKRDAFTCGDPKLDEFLRQHAGQNQFKHRSSVTYVIAEGHEVAAFVTLLPGTIRRDDLGQDYRRMPPGALPVLLLARLGVSIAFQRRGFGSNSWWMP